MHDHNRSQGVRVTAVSLLATLGSVVFVAAEAGVIAVRGPLVEIVIGVLCCLLGTLLWRDRSVESSERGVRASFAAAVGVMGAALVLQGCVDTLISHQLLDAGLRTAAFGLGGVAFTSLIYRGLVHWNQFRVEATDSGDWLNGVAGVLAATSMGQVVVSCVGAPMSHWPDFQQLLWLLNSSTLLVQLGTAATVGVLGGMTRDRRLHLVVAALTSAAVTNLVAGLLAGPAVNAAVGKAGWVGVAIVLSVGSLMTPAPVRPPTGVSQSPLTGALVVIGATIVALALGDLLGETNGASVTVAVAGAVAGGARLLQLISSLAELAESKIEARTDHLTGIANRRALSLAMVAARNRGVGAALVVVDLDRFQDVNDQYGHAVGDEVLRSVAVRLKELVPVGGVLGRLGGDEFAAILPAGQLADGRRFATEVLTAVARPVATSAGPIYLDATVGVAATSPADIQPRKVAATPGLGLHRPGPRDLDPGELLRQADAALAEAKTSGRGISVYDSAADARASLERRRLSELRELLSREHDGRAGGVVMHYQPQIDLRTGTVAGAEALVRWQHPEHGLLGPGEFVDLVERHGLMQEMTEQVLHRAASDAGRWVRAGHDVPVSINVSTSSLRPELLSRIDAALSEGDLHPRHLQLEVTETTLMADPQRSLQVLRELSRRGTSVSIDDYGTGYSSLAYLNELEAVELKLDRSFVARLVHDPRTAAIVAGTVDLAHGLGLHVVAEGVEDVATAHVLMAMGCDRSQGFLHARPMPVGRFLVWLGQDHRPVRLETEPQEQMLSR